MRRCKDCGRWLPVEDFVPGSNWMQCKKCKSHQVQMRAHHRRGDYDTPVKFEQDGRFQWFQDWLAFTRQARRVLRADAEAAYRQESQRSQQNKAYCASQKDRWDSLALLDLDEWTRTTAFNGARRSRAKDNTAKRKARRLDPQRERAKDRAKRNKNSALYKALSQKSSANRRSRLAVKTTVPLDIVWLEADGRCSICWEPCDPTWWHLDHVVPLAAGGEHSVENCAPAHPYCNLHKGARSNGAIDVDWLRVTRPVWEASDAAKRLRNGGQAPCGTEQRYSKGCRCEECRKAHRLAAQERRKRSKSRSGTNPCCNRPADALK